MFLFRRAALSALVATAAAVAMMASAVPASAARATPNAFGQILCSGPYLCLQTDSVDALHCTAVVATWANTSSFYGRFQMIEETSVGNEYLYSNTRTWPAGGTNHKFTVGIEEDQYAQFEAVAQRDVSGKYSNIGSKSFSINAECV